MAAPTISTVTPAQGHTGGKTLVEVVGSNFRLDPPPAAEGATSPTPYAPVRVLFGGLPATAVSVVSSTQLYCLTPESDELPVRAGDASGRIIAYGAVDVVVQNVDPLTGAAVPGESATAPAAFTFRRPDLSQESSLARVVRALIRKLNRQVIDNINIATHTDYDEATGDLLNLAYVERLPAIILSNLEIPENREHAVNEEQDFPAGDGRFISRRPPVAVDVNMNLVGVSNDPIELLNLMQAVRVFFKKNPWLEVDRHPDDTSAGTVKFELDFSFSGSVSVSRQNDNSNVQSFSGPISIRGVLLEDMPGIAEDKAPGIPSTYPHEATTAFGYVADGHSLGVQKKP